jgi:ABC-type uncharacterized transport system ATPase subunit
MRLEATTGPDGRELLAKLPGVKEVTEEKDGDYSIFQFKLDANADPTEETMRLAHEKRWQIREFSRRRPTLEDVFVELTHSDS